MENKGIYLTTYKGHAIYVNEDGSFSSPKIRLVQSNLSAIKILIDKQKIYRRIKKPILTSRDLNCATKIKLIGYDLKNEYAMTTSGVAAWVPPTAIVLTGNSASIKEIKSLQVKQAKLNREVVKLGKQIRSITESISVGKYFNSL